MSIHKCGCCRPGCEYYDSDRDESFTKKELKELVLELKERVKEIEKALTHQ